MSAICYNCSDIFTIVYVCAILADMLQDTRYKKVTRYKKLQDTKSYKIQKVTRYKKLQDTKKIQDTKTVFKCDMTM